MFKSFPNDCEMRTMPGILAMNLEFGSRKLKYEHFYMVYSQSVLIF